MFSKKQEEIERSKCVSIKRNTEFYISVNTELFCEENGQDAYGVCFCVYIPLAKQEQCYSIEHTELDYDLFYDFVDEIEMLHQIYEANQKELDDKADENDGYTELSDITDGICDYISDNCDSMCEHLAYVIKEKIKSREINLSKIYFVCLNEDINIDITDITHGTSWY